MVIAHTQCLCPEDKSPVPVLLLAPPYLSVAFEGAIDCDVRLHTNVLKLLAWHARAHRCTVHTVLYAKIYTIMLSLTTIAACIAINLALVTALPQHYPLFKRDIGSDLGPQLSTKAAIYTQSDGDFADQSARWSKEFISR